MDLSMKMITNLMEIIEHAMITKYKIAIMNK